MSELEFEFEHDGRLVRPGQEMHVAPSFHWKAGATGKVIRYYGDTVTLRSPNGAVPTVPLSALSWDAHPQTVAREELVQAGVLRPTSRDVYIWMLARGQIKEGFLP